MNDQMNDLLCQTCGKPNFYTCGCYDRCVCGHDRRSHLPEGACSLIDCRCVPHFRLPADESLAQLVARDHKIGALQQELDAVNECPMIYCPYQKRVVELSAQVADLTARLQTFEEEKDPKILARVDTTDG